MKNSRRGFIIPLVAIVAFLAIGFGVYYVNYNLLQPVKNQTAQAASGTIIPEKNVFIFVDNATYNALSSKINRLSADITSDLGVKVIVQHDTFSSPVAIRNILQKSYSSNTLIGSILIGNIPTFSRNDGFYTDWFYSDLNNSCPINSDGIFTDSIGCNTLNNLSKRDVFEGRITAPINATDAIGLIGQYLDKDHNYRIGKITFPKQLLLYPSVDILDRNNGVSVAKNSLLVNMASAIASQFRYSQQNVDVILDTDYVQQKQDYLNKLKNNRYETAVINIHGATDAQAPSQRYDKSLITSDDVVAAKPNIFYVALLACNNGAFKSPNYLAGEFLFNGDTLLVTANSQEAGISGLLQDPPAQPVFFQPLSTLNSSAPLGESFIHDQSLFVTQYFGDPTLHMLKASANTSQLQVSSKSVDFGSVYSTDSAVKTVSIKNIGKTTASILILPNWGITIDDKPTSDYGNDQGQMHILAGKNFLGFSLDQASNGFFKKINLSPNQSTSLSFTFSPAAFSGSNSVINGKYSDTYSFITSDSAHPFIDINVTIQQKKYIPCLNGAGPLLPGQSYCNTPATILKVAPTIPTTKPVIR